MRQNIFAFVLILFCICLNFKGKAQVNQQELPKKVRILFLLDGSGSMLAPWENGELRIDVAKRMLTKLVDSLQVNEDVQLALRVYGHQYDRRLKNCKDTKLEAGFGPDNHLRIKQRLAAIKPKGTTPLAYSLEQAAKDFPTDNKARNVIIIITDGLESCDGDPCAVSVALQKKNIFLKPFIIGLGMKEDYGKELECLGQYFDARNTTVFQQVLNRALRQALEKTTVSIELLDAQNQPKETDVNVTFINNVTKAPVFNFVHYLDQAGKPDSVEVDAVLSYDILVNTIPPVIQKNVHFEGGEHNVVRINAPQGQLQLIQNGHTEYQHSVQAIIRKAERMQSLNVQTIATKERYLAGNYDLEILTVPRTYLHNVEIVPGETKELRIAGPGVLNIVGTKFPGIGSLYRLKEDGTQEWVLNLPEGKPRMIQALQPGNYRLVFRAYQAMGSKYTKIKDFSIKSGATVTINLFGK